jgi:hypothetical protein
MLGELVVFGVAVALFAFVGVRVGMLVARRLDRMAEPEEEVADDGND